jgi:hypothetical protein
MGIVQAVGKGENRGVPQGDLGLRRGDLVRKIGDGTGVILMLRRVILFSHIQRDGQRNASQGESDGQQQFHKAKVSSTQ